MTIQDFRHRINAKRGVACESFPEFQTCVNAAVVCRAFGETNRRRLVLNFTHHGAKAALISEKHRRRRFARRWRH